MLKDYLPHAPPRQEAQRSDQRRSQQLQPRHRLDDGHDRDEHRHQAVGGATVHARLKSRVLWEQMLGRGTRVVNAIDLQAVTPDAHVKDHFVIVDAVSVVDNPKSRHSVAG